MQTKYRKAHFYSHVKEHLIQTPVLVCPPLLPPPACCTQVIDYLEMLMSTSDGAEMAEVSCEFLQSNSLSTLTRQHTGAVTPLGMRLYRWESLKGSFLNARGRAASDAGVAQGSHPLFVCTPGESKVRPQSPGD
eukprot:1159554-Pelagomonas_calceolata.AAC.4